MTWEGIGWVILHFGLETAWQLCLQLMRSTDVLNLKSTLPSTIFRFLDMGLPPILLLEARVVSRLLVVSISSFEETFYRESRRGDVTWRLVIALISSNSRNLIVRPTRIRTETSYLSLPLLLCKFYDRNSWTDSLFALLPAVNVLVFSVNFRAHT